MTSILPAAERDVVMPPVAASVEEVTTTTPITLTPLSGAASSISLTSGADEVDVDGNLQEGALLLSSSSLYSNSATSVVSDDDGGGDGELNRSGRSLSPSPPPRPDSSLDRAIKVILNKKNLDASL